MTSERAKWLCLVPAVIIIVPAVIALILTRKPAVHEAQEIASAQVEQQAIDLTKPGNQPYLPARMELFQPEMRFEIVGTDVTSGAGLRWVFVARNRKTEDGMIFRVLIGDSFGPIERGRVVRLGQVHFWSNPGHVGDIVVVLAIE